MEKTIKMVIANPAENCNNSMNISYHTSLDNQNTYILYRKKNAKKWIKVYPKVHKVDVFDNVLSIDLDRSDKYEKEIFLHCCATLDNLEIDTTYKYQIDGNGKKYTFKTSPSKNFSFAWISDFHTYLLSPNRLKNASFMIDRIIKKEPKCDFIFCSGDAIAWGGSYSFWEEFYNIPSIRKFMWANTLGNHDYMSRGNLKNTSEYFKEVNNFPLNGFKGEEGVCYFFKYSNALFIVMHNEHMGVNEVTNEEVKKAQQWVEEVIKNNPSKFIFLCQHYQWINGVNGLDRKFGYERWKNICDKYHIDLAIAANDHTYVRTYPLFHDEISNYGTVYMQCPSSDGDRGQEINESIDNPKVAFRYSNGLKTIGGIFVEVSDMGITTTLYDENMSIIDKAIIKKEKNKI